MATLNPSVPLPKLTDSDVRMMAFAKKVHELAGTSGLPDVDVVRGLVTLITVIVGERIPGQQPSAAECSLLSEAMDTLAEAIQFSQAELIYTALVVLDVKVVDLLTPSPAVSLKPAQNAILN